MREILFRGQTRRHGEKVNMRGDKLPGRWVYGGVLQGPGDFSIIYGGENLGDIEKHTVYTDTIGQYIGKPDKNGVKIYEGDIVEICMPLTGVRPIVQRSEVYFDHGCYCVLWGGSDRFHNRSRIDGFIPQTTFEVIGNIHDNPELIGGGAVMEGDTHEQKS